MSEKINDIDEQIVPEPEEKTAEEVNAANGEVSFEENDNWQFDAEAMTINNDLLVSETEEDEPIQQPAPKPRAVATEKKPEPVKKPKQKGEAPLFIAIAVITAVVIAVLVVLGVRYYTVPNSDEKMNPGNVAVTVGDTDVSVGMYNYYYTCISQNYINYAGYGYYDLDTTKSYDKQMTTNPEGEQVSWAQLFKDETMNQIQYITTYYEKALDAGITLSKSQQKTVKDQLDSLKDAASEQDMSVDEYISTTYGDYCGYATLKLMLEQCYLAENYYQQLQVDQKVPEDKLNKYIDEHSDDYANVTFAYLQLIYDAEDNESHSKATESAIKYTKEIKSKKDLVTLIPVACNDIIEEYVAAGYFKDADEAAQAMAENVEATISKSEEGFLDTAIDWLFDDSTKINDVEYFDDEENSVIYILLKLTESKLDDSKVYSVRHILVTPEADNAQDDEQAPDEDVVYTDAQWKAAYKKAESIVDEYNSGDKTEYAFALLAEKYSDDIESTSNGSSGMYGGLYAGTSLGTMVKSFEKWSTDDARKYGDVDIVKSKYGYHIMFFVENTTNFVYQCETEVKKEIENDFIKDTPIKQHKSVMKKAKVATPQKESADMAQMQGQVE